MTRPPSWNCGTPFGMPHVAGLREHISPADPPGLKVFCADEPLRPDRQYLTAGTDLEFEDYGGYLNLAGAQVDYELPTIMPEMLDDYLTRHAPIGAFNQRFFLEE